MVSCGYPTAVGVFVASWFKRSWNAYFAYLAYILATLLALAQNLLFHPPLFGYHPISGYFPGPIYDGQITISDSLLIARGTTLLLTWLCLPFASNMFVFDRQVALSPILHFQRLYRFKLRFVDVLCASAFNSISKYVLVDYLNYAELGPRPTRTYIEKRLRGIRETKHFKILYEKGSKVECQLEWIVQD